MTTECKCLTDPENSPCGNLEDNESACLCVDDTWQLPP